MNEFKLDEKINIIGKNVSGTVAYIGKTHFAKGEWFGIILDQPEGRNNGCVDGKFYFKCPRNFGTFVRACQLEKRSRDEQYSNASKPLYPNYLQNSSKVRANKVQNIKKEQDEGVVKKETIMKHNFPGNVEYLNNMRGSSQGMCSTRRQKTKVIEKFEIIENEHFKTCDVNKILNNENIVKEELLMALKQVDILKRKLWKAEKNFEQSERKRLKLVRKIDSLEEITEFAIVDKEIAEELLKDEVEKCKQLVAEKEILKEGMQIQQDTSVPAVHYVKKLENEKAVLSSALYKLRDLYNSLRKCLLLSEKALENYSNEIESLKVAEVNLQNVISKYREEVEELYETIDCMLYADEMVYELAERNLNSENNMCYLSQALQEAEDYIQVSNEMEETLEEIKSICSEEIECLKSKVKIIQFSMNQKILILKNQEEIIENYRELASVLRYRNHKLSIEFEKVFTEKQEAVIAAESIKLKNQRGKARTMTEIIEIESLKIDLNSFKDQIEYWTPFMPNNFFERGGENYAIQVRLTASKMSSKLNLLIDTLKSSLYEVCDSNNKCLEILMRKTVFLVFAYKLRYILETHCNSIDQKCFKSFLSVGKNYDIMLLKYSEIENYLKLMCSEEIDRKSCLVSIKKTYCTLSELLECKYAHEIKEVSFRTDCFLKTIKIVCKCSLELCLALNSLKVTADCELKMKQASKLIKILETDLSSIIIFINNCDKDNTHPLPEVPERLEIISTHIQEVMDEFMSFYTNFTDATKEAESQSTDQNFQNFDKILTKLKVSSTDLGKLRILLKNGQLFTECTAESSYLTHVAEWAKHKKREYEKSISDLRRNVVSLESEISSLTQAFQKTKATKENHTDTIKEINITPVDENIKNLNEIITKAEVSSTNLSEVSLNENALFTKCTVESIYLSTVDEWTEHKEQEKKTIEDIRENFTSLESKIFPQDLQVQRSTESKQISTESTINYMNCDLTSNDSRCEVETQTNLVMCHGACSSEKEHLLLKLKDMESSIRYLYKRNSELKKNSMSYNQKSLVPLVVSPKPRYHPDVHDICVLKRKLNELAMKLRGSLVPFVVDITKKHGNKEKMYRRYLVNRMLVCKEVEEDIWKIILKIRSLRNMQGIGWSYVNPFPFQNARHV